MKRSLSPEQALENLREENARLREALSEKQSLLSIAPAMFGFLDLDGVVTVLNEQSLKASGVSKEQIIGRHFWDCPWWKPLPESARQIAELVHRGVAGLESHRFLDYWSVGATGNGSVRHVDLSIIPIRDDRGNLSRLAATGIDITERRIARLAVQRSEEQLAAAVSVSRIGFFDWDVIRNTVTYSEQMLRDWGFSAAGPIEQAIAAIHPDDRERFREKIAESLSGPKPFREEYRVIKPEGSVVWIQAEGRVEFDELGRALRFFGTSRDVSEQKRNEEKIRQNEEQIRRYADAMPQMAFIADAQGNIEYFNQRHYDYFGYSQADSMGQLWRNQTLHHPEDIAPTLATWENSLRTGEPYQIEYRLLRRDGVYHWHLGRAVPYRDESGQIVKWYGTNTDIHEQKIAEQIASERSVLLGRVIETIPHAIWRTNYDGSADYVSQSFRSSVGYELDEVIGWDWANLIHPDDRDRVMREWERCRQAGTGISVEFRIKGKDDVYRWYLSMGSPFRNEAGDITKYYGTWTNLDDQIQAREKLRKLAKDLQLAVDSRDEFLSIASHELKTPLTTLRLQSQSIQRRLRKTGTAEFSAEQLVALANQTDRQVTRLVRLVDDMLDISRIRSGQLAIVKEKIELGSLIRDTAARLKPLFTAAGGEIPEISDGPLLEGVWDRLRLEQVITNLLANAIRYGNGKPISIKLTRENGLARIEVKDQGIGIDKEKQRKIFDRYERAVSAEDASGLGLGLFIAKEIVLAHHGDIWVESELGKGSTFVVTLPTVER